MSEKKPTLKARNFLKFFLDQNSSKTFLNQYASAQAAGYSESRSAGNRLFKRFQPEILAALDNVILSEAALKRKMSQLIDAKRTVFFQKDGKVIETREVDALDVQAKVLKMAGVWTGVKPADRIEITGNLNITGKIKPDMTAKEAADVFNALVRGKEEK